MTWWGSQVRSLYCPPLLHDYATIAALPHGNCRASSSAFLSRILLRHRGSRAGLRRRRHHVGGRDHGRSEQSIHGRAAAVVRIRRGQSTGAERGQWWDRAAQRRRRHRASGPERCRQCRRQWCTGRTARRIQCRGRTCAACRAAGSATTAAKSSIDAAIDAAFHAAPSRPTGVTIDAAASPRPDKVNLNLGSLPLEGVTPLLAPPVVAINDWIHLSADELEERYGPWGADG